MLLSYDEIQKTYIQGYKHYDEDDGPYDFDFIHIDEYSFCPYCEEKTPKVATPLLENHYYELPFFSKDNKSKAYVVSVECQNCECNTIWVVNETSEQMIEPRRDMKLFKPIHFYDEKATLLIHQAMAVSNISPISTVFLCRAVIEYFLAQEGVTDYKLFDKINNYDGSNENKIIKQGLDSLRILGNGAAHGPMTDLTQEESYSLATESLALIFYLVDLLNGKNKIKPIFDRIFNS